MDSNLTTTTIYAFSRLEDALSNQTNDDLNELVSKIKELYEKALTIQELKNEFNSGSYDT